MIGRFAVLLGAISAILLGSAPLAAAPLVLERVVLVMRHGIRPPTKAPPLPAGLTTAAWPDWPVPPGYLTPHGAAAVRLLAAYEREDFAARGLIASTGCPGGDAVHIWTDVDERTIKTGEAFAEGFAPRCPLPVGHSAADTDPLFSPMATGAVAFDARAARAAIERRAGPGGVQGFADAHRVELTRLQAVLGCCSVATCDKFAVAHSCGLPDLPTTLKDTAKEEPKLEGGLGLGATLSEILLLEYAEGKPSAEVGFGRIDRVGLLAALALHPAEFDLLHRTSYVATRGAAPLLHRIADLLDAKRLQLAPKLSVFVGHDTTLAYLGGALGLHWQAAGYPRDDPPPGATLGFELLHDARGAQFVRIFFMVQTLDQLRELRPMTAVAPPARIYLSVSGCVTTLHGSLCPAASFLSKLAGIAVTPNEQEDSVAAASPKRARNKL